MPTNGAPVTLERIARATNGVLLAGDRAAAITDVTHDSRQVRPGALFVAVRGAAFDGNKFVKQAVAAGAAGVMSEDPPDGESESWVRVADARRALALAAAEVNDHPSRDLKLVGITGTNGKTTTAYLVAALAEGAGDKTALAGTIESRVGDEVVKSERTTGEASDVQRFLRRAVDAGCRAAVMECSSHAIDLHRCDALEFGAAVFTNLTRDHLDYHRTMDAYFASKKKLFDGSLGSTPRVSIVNVDDERGARLSAELKSRGRRVTTYALDQEADLVARDVEISFAGMRFALIGADAATVTTPLVGRPHVYNILAAVGVGLALGYDLQLMTEALRSCAGAPGRFERVPHDEKKAGARFAVIVDYAHTDDALANVLQTARRIAEKRVITVFGCGGDRDRTKRAPMGEIAARLSDVVIVTSDNPRTEDPGTILAEIEIGLRQHPARAYEKVIDRRVAIGRAVAQAGDGDVVIIAGKGHEDYQIIGREQLPFDDRQVAREALAARGL